MVNNSSCFDISVIIPTYNRSILLRYSLLSLCQQNIDKSRFEVVICDDGSSDDTRSVVREYEKLLNIKYVFQEDKGYRPASARNKGIGIAEGRICLFIDSGVLVNNNCLEEHIHFYNRAGAAVAVVGYVYGFDRTQESVNKIRSLINPHNMPETISVLSKDELFFDVREEHYTVYKDEIHELPASWYYYWTCHVSASRAELIEAGMFDENFDGRWGIEDNDLAFRLNQRGVKIYLLRSAEAIHYPHEKDKEERRAEAYQNCMYFHDKHNTTETKIFLDNYMNSLEFVDINKKICDLKKVNESVAEMR